MNSRHKRKYIELLITIFGWAFLVVFLYNLLTNIELAFNLKFYQLGIFNSNAIILFTIFVLIIIFSSLTSWSSYNRKKFGPLTRRTFPENTKIEEISAAFNIPENEIEKMKEQRWIDR